MDENRNKNTKALVIGIFLIFLVASITILRSLKTPASPAASTTEDSANDTVKKDKLMEPGELTDRLKRNEDITIIDIRDADSFAAEHIVGSINMPIDNFSYMPFSCQPINIMNNKFIII